MEPFHISLLQDHSALRYPSGEDRSCIPYIVSRLCNVRDNIFVPKWNCIKSDNVGLLWSHTDLLVYLHYRLFDQRPVSHVKLYIIQTYAIKPLWYGKSLHYTGVCTTEEGIVWILVSSGPIKLSSIKRCPYYGDVHKDGFYLNTL